MATVLPNYDRERVHAADIKKLIKWFNFLHSRDLLQEVEASDEPTTAETSPQLETEA
jgi:hypothetical protein